MFLLMAIGYILAGSVLFSEIVGGCAKSCRAFLRRNSQVDEAMRRGSSFSLSQLEAEEPKNFKDKMKRKIRRSLRSKPKPVEEPKDETVEPQESEEPKGPDEPEEPELKGPTSFCTLKRIMLMRKKRKEDKRALKENNVVDVTKEEPKKSNFENYFDFEEGAIGSEQLTIENEKTNVESADEASLFGSSSVNSVSHVIREETEAEVNQLTISDREKHPSKEFGEVV